MTPREPDRYEEKARQIVDVTIDCMNGKMDHAECVSVEDHIAAALRAEHDEALERAAQWHEERAVAVERALPSVRAAGWFSEADFKYFALRMTADREDAKSIRALKSPAAAPAAVTGPVLDVFGRATPLPPPSEPAAPEKEIANLLGRGHVRNPREGEPGDAETYSSPAPLLPRILAALEQEASAHDDFDSTYEHAAALALRALAAELRAYIAERAPHAKGEG